MQASCFLFVVDFPLAVSHAQFMQQKLEKERQLTEDELRGMLGPSTTTQWLRLSMVF